MSLLELRMGSGRGRLGLKGPRALEWLAGRGIAVPEAPNRWVAAGGADEEPMLVARLGSSEFFLEEGSAQGRLRGLRLALESAQPGVYPVLREDVSFALSGPGTHEVLAQVCNVNFAGLDTAQRPVIMTLMIGVAVLCVPQTVNAWPYFRIWCDPTFGAYMEESLETVVAQSGGNYLRST